MGGNADGKCNGFSGASLLCQVDGSLEGSIRA
jgi:hypothetical protein